MISSAGFEPASVPAQILASVPAQILAPAPAPTPDSYHAFQTKSFFTNWKLKIQNLNYIISKRCFDIFIDNSKTLFWIFKENKWLKLRVNCTCQVVYSALKDEGVLWTC